MMRISRIDSVTAVKYGEYNAAARYWPVRANVRGACKDPVTVASSTFVGVGDFRLSRNDFGEWVARPTSKPAVQHTQVPIQNPFLANPSASPAQQSAQLSPQWFGSWRAADGSRSLDLSAAGARVLDIASSADPKTNAPPVQLQWSTNTDPEEGQFAYAGYSANPLAVAGRYAAALEQSRRSPADFKVTEPAAAKRAFAAIAPGNYRVIRARVWPGSCGVYDWIVDNGNLLEILDCKYEFSVRLLSRAK